MQRQRLRQPADRHIETHGRASNELAASSVRAEELDGVGDLQRAPCASALVQHRGRQAGHAELARRVVAAAGLHHQVHLRERHFVGLHEPHRPGRSTSVRFWIGGSVKCGRGARAAGGFDRSGRSWAPQRTGTGNRHDRARRQGRERPPRTSSSAASGSTTSSTRGPAGSHSSAAACTSAGGARCSAPDPPRSSRGRRWRRK